MEQTPVVTPGVVPGTATSEFQLTNRASWIGIAMMVVGVLVEVADALVTALTPIAAQYPDLKWVGAILLVAGTILKVATTFGYQKSRAVVKAAQLTAPGFSAVPPQAPPQS